MIPFLDGEKPLSNDEKQLLIAGGWEFARDKSGRDINYIYKPNDYDGCMVDGIRGIRQILAKIQLIKVLEWKKP